MTLEERPLPFINDATHVHSAPAPLEITSRLEDLLLRELQESMIPISLKQLQVQISPTHPGTAITMAATLDGLYRKGRVIRSLAGEGRAHYVYSVRSMEQLDLLKGRQ